MGYVQDKHIKLFVQGKVIKELTTDDNGFVYLLFEDGESLRLAPLAKHPPRPSCDIIATPYRADGTVKQSMEIVSPLALDVESTEE